MLLWSPNPTWAQNTYIAVLNGQEQQNLRKLIEESPRVTAMYDSIVSVAEGYLGDKPNPVGKMFYEGLVNTAPRRMETEKSLADFDKITAMIYASYGGNPKKYRKLIKAYILAWAKAYQPDGNTIHENKFISLFWAYHLFQDAFSKKEQTMVEAWMTQIADKQREREHTPNSNWMAKRHKIIGMVGCITGQQALIDFAVEGFKAYINSAYHPDGTSNDLRKRDALGYHCSGLKNTLTALINCSKFDPGFDMFEYVAPSGSSLRKSVEYVAPYALGEKVHEEWVNSQVTLDKKRAEAGLAKYQPGVLFKEEEGKELFEWACYFEPKWYEILHENAFPLYQTTWVGLLNSPLVRE